MKKTEHDLATVSALKGGQPLASLTCMTLFFSCLFVFIELAGNYCNLHFIGSYGYLSVAVELLSRAESTARKRTRLKSVSEPRLVAGLIASDSSLGQPAFSRIVIQFSHRFTHVLSSGT
jgi:hypothetical protein